MDRTLGHYTVTGEIGRGGMAVVYRAVQESLNRTVALKELDLSRFRSEPAILERFRLEARSAAALEHPNIITIYDLWEVGEKAYIAMEFIDGVELKEAIVKKAPLDFACATLIALEVCEALHYAHGRGMVHRDVKPGNIMLSRKGDVRLMDFGIVSVAGTGDLTVSGQVLGTPAYMSPEQIEGEELGPGVDIFSLGVILYEMLTAKRPFSGENQLALIQRILRTEPAPPTELVREIPEGLSGTVMRCLAKEPGDRYASMGELAAALKKTLPPGAPSREAGVANLVAQTGLPSSVTGFEETSIIRPAPGLTTRDAAKVTGLIEPGTPDAEVGSAKRFLPDDQGGEMACQLEMDPPADLPPLDLPGSGTPEDSRSSPYGEQPEIPLSFKELPPEETVDRDVEGRASAGRSRGVRHIFWILPLTLVVGFAVWKFPGGPLSGIIAEKVQPPSGPASLAILADPGTRILIDGEPLGDAQSSGTIEIEPGLHRIEAVNPRLGKREFIIDIEPGQMKRIEIRFDP